MIEQVFTMTRGDDKIIERLIADEHVNINHMILNKEEGLPDHDSNANVYMHVLRGILSITLGEQEEKTYEEGSILKIPEGIPMKVRNHHQEQLELLVVKVPAPGK